MKIIVEDFILKHLLLSEICALEIFEKFVYKLSETIESTFQENYKLRGVNNSIILRIKNAKFSGHCFYMNTNI